MFEVSNGITFNMNRFAFLLVLLFSSSVWATVGSNQFIAVVEHNYEPSVISYWKNSSSYMSLDKLPMSCLSYVNYDYALLSQGSRRNEHGYEVLRRAIGANSVGTVKILPLMLVTRRNIRIKDKIFGVFKCLKELTHQGLIGVNFSAGINTKKTSEFYEDGRRVSEINSEFETVVHNFLSTPEGKSLTVSVAVGNDKKRLENVLNSQPKATFCRHYFPNVYCVTGYDSNEFQTQVADGSKEKPFDLIFRYSARANMVALAEREDTSYLAPLFLVWKMNARIVSKDIFVSTSSLDGEGEEVVSIKAIQRTF